MDNTNSNSAKGDLVQDLAELLKTHSLADITVIAGNEKFHAHRMILAARSSVFAAMFQHKELEENRKNEVKIEDIPPAVVKAMLEFMYTDKVTDFKALVKGLLVAANKYDLERLKKLCEEYLCESLTAGNVAENLVLANLHSARKLKARAVQFIASNLPDVINSEGYKAMEVTSPALLGELLRAVAVEQKKLKQQITQQASVQQVSVLQRPVQLENIY